MQKICRLQYPPVFIPVVDDYYKGMAVTVMLAKQAAKWKEIGRRDSSGSDLALCGQEAGKSPSLWL